MQTFTRYLPLSCYSLLLISSSVDFSANEQLNIQSIVDAAGNSTVQQEHVVGISIAVAQQNQ